MRRPAPTMLFLFAFVIRHGFVSLSGNLYVNLLVIIDDTVNQGDWEQGG